MKLYEIPDFMTSTLLYGNDMIYFDHGSNNWRYVYNNNLMANKMVAKYFHKDGWSKFIEKKNKKKITFYKHYFTQTYGSEIRGYIVETTNNWDVFNCDRISRTLLKTEIIEEFEVEEFEVEE